MIQKSMKILLKADTVTRLEELAGEKMTTRCDKVVNQALDNACNLEIKQ